MAAQLLVFATLAAAQLRIPEPTGYINDFANVISAEDETAIERIILEVRQKSGGEIAVVTLPSLEGRARTDVALQILRDWGVGRSGEAGDTLRNTGTVILVVPKETSDDGDGHVQIATGYATNTFITAAEAGRIRDQHMIPRFVQRDYGGGIYAGVSAVARQYADRFGFELTGAVAQEPPADTGRAVRTFNPFAIFIGIVVLFWLLSRFGGGGRGGGGFGRRRGLGGWWLLPLLLSRGGRGRGGWGMGGGGWGGGGLGGGGFGGGGFGGFGGGSGGGGGAGGSW